MTKQHVPAVLLLCLIPVLAACDIRSPSQTPNRSLFDPPVGNITPTLPAQSSGSATPDPSAVDRAILTDGDFTPDGTQVAELEARLPEFLAQNQNKFNPTQAPIVERFPTYKRQYWGELKDGKQIIILNAMCRPIEGWQTQQVMILDGGDCYFMLEYDPASKTFSNLSVNGEA